MSDYKPLFGGIPKVHALPELAMSSKTQAGVTLKSAPDGVVLYADAGARPNPGFAGWGIHGYVYKTKDSKKGSGHTTHVPTARGYTLKNVSKASSDAADQEVDVLAYLDNTGAFGDNFSNNAGEILAAAYALELALKYEVATVLLYSDSKYTVEGITKWIGKWLKFKWRRPDGTEYANRENWERLLDAKRRLEARGATVAIEWMYGHVGDVGNERADAYATIGVMRSIDGLVNSELEVSEPDGYWKYDAERHPMLSARALYYLNDAEHIQPGVYYTGAHGKDDEALGTRMTEGSYAIVKLTEPDTTVELLRSTTVELARKRRRTESVFMLGNLDSLHRPETHQLISNHGKYAMVPSSPTHLLLTAPASKELLVCDLTPSRNSFRALGAIEELDAVLHAYSTGSTEVVITDLTEVLYETVTKPKGKKEVEIFQLKEIYNVGFSVLPVQAKHPELGGLTESEVKLILGVDLLNRNALKRLESLEPKVKLLTWCEPESSLVFRYATVIEAQGCSGIWSGHYSNYRFLGEALPAKKKK